MNKKGISIIVGTSLLLLISILSVISLEQWFETYSNSLENKIYQTSSEKLRISHLDRDNLYLIAENNVSIISLKISNSNNEIVCQIFPEIILNQLRPYQVVYFDFESKNSTHIFDLSGNGNHGEIINNTNCDFQGFEDNSCVFDGENNRIQIPRNPSIEPKSLTVATWFYWDSPSKSTWGKVINKHKETNTYPFKSYEIGHFSNTKGMTFTINNGSHFHETPYYDIKEKEWIFLTGTWNSDLGVLSFYTNGKIVSNKSNISGEITYYDTDLVLGWENTTPMHSNRAIAGTLDEFFLYNKSLNESEVFQLYKTTRSLGNQTINFSNTVTIDTQSCLLNKDTYSVTLTTSNQVIKSKFYVD